MARRRPALLVLGTVALLAGIAAACSSTPAAGPGAGAGASTAGATTTTAAAATSTTAGGSGTAATTPTTVPVSEMTPSSTTDQAIGMPASSLDEAALPLGSDKASTAPERGYEWLCTSGFPSGGPDVSTLPWVDSSKATWDLQTKVAASGWVTHDDEFSVEHEGSEEVLSGNGLPPVSGTFPVTSGTADRYYPDPTPVYAHKIEVELPYDPTEASAASCIPAVVGITVTGIPILDAFDANGNDAAAVEVQDRCHGHPNQVVGYHYHSLSPCLLSPYAKSHTTQVGWALDGFGIYVEYDSKGRLLTDADLDACHGRTSVVPWHGKMVDIYHYDMTIDFPYVVGCFRGTPIPDSDASGIGYGTPPAGGGPGGP